MSDPAPLILCVEDDKDSREMIQYLLRNAEKNYTVMAVGTGAEALAINAKNSFDLYVLDIWLPGMDGFELCRRIRERGSTKPIMFFSAMVRPDDRKYGLAAGANEFLVKPNDLDIFTDTVERLLKDGSKDIGLSEPPV
ncbi:MAG: response regulator [Blastocatellia bacterium]|nr:response regulator [Blastocatellia bacterium]MDQ3220264.1 response regulator [Acidobacteriota bacterium]